ncbi:hypothetical protein RAN53_09405 [Halomonas sp. SSL-5]|uniref:hypothetical protein n=1 Tax=Halomonas sp. SSL-5 TaxID=3065855 RepID=UPI00273919E9|nr:hypothetical protein [Halomonas sp. SSL-5]MDY7116566.1 hypothetical protein [Halomonas sp. SSL-5]
MSSRYLIVETPSQRPRVPRCDLGPHISRKAAKAEAARQGLADFTIVPIKRRSA